VKVKPAVISVNDAVFCHKLLSPEFATYDGVFSQPRPRSLGRRQGVAARGPTGLPEALVSLNPAGRFQLFKRPDSARRNVAALFASSLNGDTGFRIAARSSGMRFALDGDSQINFARRIVCNPANENGDSQFQWPSPFEHRNERMNSMIFEALLAAIGSAGYIAIQVRWALRGGR
jgi:hypothetical protein